MKRTKIFAAASTCVLLLAAMFATKAARRFTVVATVYYLNGSSYDVVWSGATIDNVVTKTSNANGYAVLSGYQLFTAGPGHAKLYIPF